MREANIKSERFRKFSSMRQNLTTFICRKGSQGSRVEPGVFKTETSVHAVRSELERNLLNVPLKNGMRIRAEPRIAKTKWTWSSFCCVAVLSFMSDLT